MKKSFTNVRLDILNIKSYLEKQHDILNSELADLQSQLFSVKRELKESKKSLGEDYLPKEDVEKRLKTQIKGLKELRQELEETDSRINRLSKDLSVVERESLSPAEFEKKTREMAKEISEIRSELDDEFELIGEDLRDIRKDLSKELIHEQAKFFDKKIKELEKSINEVDSLKKDLKNILKSAEKKDKVKKEVKKLEKKVDKKPFYKRVWHGIVDFFEEEPEDVIVKKVEKKPKKKVVKEKKPGLAQRAWHGLVDFFTEEVDEKPKEVVKKSKKRKPKKKKRDYKPLIFGFFILLIVLGLGYWYFSDEINNAFNNFMGLDGTTGEAPEEEEGIVITVTENDFVNIIPDASDPDKDKLTYTFSYPLNKDGQWQTQIGDAGTYKVTVTVSDGQTETEMEFTLVVKPLEP